MMDFWCKEHYTHYSVGVQCDGCVRKRAVLLAGERKIYSAWLELSLPREVWLGLVNFIDPRPNHPDFKLCPVFLSYELSRRAIYEGTNIFDELRLMMKAKSVEEIFPLSKEEMIKKISYSQRF